MSATKPSEPAGQEKSETRPAAYYFTESGQKLAYKVEFNAETETWFYLDPKDNLKYEYDGKTKAWFPMVIFCSR